MVRHYTASGSVNTSPQLSIPLNLGGGAVCLGRHLPAPGAHGHLPPILYLHPDLPIRLRLSHHLQLRQTQDDGDTIVLSSN